MNKISGTSMKTMTPILSRQHHDVTNITVTITFNQARDKVFKINDSESVIQMEITFLKKKLPIMLQRLLRQVKTIKFIVNYIKLSTKLHLTTRSPSFSMKF